MNRIYNYLAIGAVAVCCVSCQSDEPGGGGKTPYRPIELNPDTRSAVTAGNEFSLKLLNNVAEDDNIVISPYSVFSVLSMIANADQADVRDQILTEFGYADGEIGLKALNDYCGIMNSNMSGLDGRVKVQMTNSFWSEAQITPIFHSILKDPFYGEWIRKNPGTPEAMDHINKYVSDNTGGMVKNFIDKPLNDDCMLLNTVYFNGSWQKEFDKKFTNNENFNNLNGGVGTASFMKIEDSFKVFADENLAAVELPYGSGNYVMTVLKPSDKVTFQNFRGSLSNESLSEILSNMKFQNIFLCIPKFESVWSSDMVGTLKDMGFYKVFGNRILNIISDQTCVFNNFRHAASIQVGEEGTKVAAASAAAGDVSSGPVDIIKFDSPFIYLIRETSTNTILFAGQITNF